MRAARRARLRVGVLLLTSALAGSCTEKNRTTDTRSTAFATAKERNAFLCAYVICPTPPEDSAYHVVFHDNSGGLLAGSNDFDIRAVAKVAPDDVAQWRKSCSPKRVDPRPGWLAPVLAERGWAPATAPDTYLCGREQRIVHVREGLVILWARSD